MKRTILALAVILSATVFAIANQPTTAIAAKPDAIGTFGAWGAYSYMDEQGNKVCFMSSKPEKSDASVKNAKRGDIFLFITHWQGDGTKNVVSAALGYGVKTGSKGSLSIDGKSYNVFGEGETLWTKDQATDDTLAAALQKGSKAVVKATSKRGTDTTDTYSLKGSGDAYKAISQACGF